MDKETLKIYRRSFCGHLYQLAKDKGITHRQIADKTGFTESNVSRMLSGKYSPSLDNFMALATALDCSFYLIEKQAAKEVSN